MGEEYRLQIVSAYFLLELKHTDIKRVLFEEHGHVLSVRQLIRILQKENLYIYKNSADIMTVVDFIMSEQRGSEGLHGYQKKTYRGTNTRKEEIKFLLIILGPEGTLP